MEEDAKDKRIVELEGELVMQNWLTEIYRQGLPPGYRSWKKAAMLLRQELKRLDPANQLESQLDWRIEGGQIDEIEEVNWAQFVGGGSAIFLKQHQIDSDRIAELKQRLEADPLPPEIRAIIKRWRDASEKRAGKYFGNGVDFLSRMMRDEIAQMDVWLTSTEVHGDGDE